jgi:hypothetical protein
VAGGLDPAATTARHRTEEGGREKREREKRGLNDSNSNFSQKILLKQGKTLNMKVVKNFKCYTFCFRH